MNGDKKYYRVKGKTLALPEDKVDGFLDKYPDAEELDPYTFNGKTFALPKDKVEGFLQKFPDAKLLYDIEKKSQEPQEPIQQEELIGTTQEDSFDEPKRQEVQTSVFGFNQGFTKPEVVEDPIEPADPEARTNLEDLSNSLYNTWQGIKTSFLDLATGVQMPKYKIEQLAESGIKTLQDRFDVSDEVADVTQSMFDILSDGTMGMVSLGELGIGMINSDLKPEETSESLASIAQKTSALREKMRPVTPALESIRKGDVAGVATGAVNGALGYVPSILVGAATRGLGFIPMFAGSAFNEGVAEKARLNPEIQQELSQGLKKDLTDQEIREIIKSGEADVFLPALMGGVAGMLEKYGLGKAKKMLTEKILSNKGLNVIKDVLFEGGRQGFINWLEGGLMQYNVDYAKSGDLIESAVNMADWLVSEEGANAAIEATLGTMLTGGVGAGARRFSRKNEETQEPVSKEAPVEETPKFREKTLKTEEDSYKFVGKGDEMVFETGGLTQEKANQAVEELSKKYPKVNFQVKDNTDKSDPYAEPNFTIISSPVKNKSYVSNPLKNVESTIEALKGVPVDNKTDLERAQSRPFWEAWYLVPWEFKDYIDGGDNSMQRMMATAYHSAKKDGSNPELVSAVESILLKQKESRYTQGEETLDREELQSRIEEAESVEDLEGIDIENDTELEGQFKSKMDEVSVKAKEGLTESAKQAERVIPVRTEEEAEVGDYFTREIDGETIVYEKGEDVSRIIPPNEYDRIEREETEQQPESEERVVVEDVQQEQPTETTDTEVSVEEQENEKDAQKVKFEEKQKTINIDKKLTDTKELQEGDYVAVKSDNGTVYEGFVTRKGRKKISVESSSMYGVSESQFKIENVEAFYKPKKTNETAKETDSEKLLEGVQETRDQDKVRQEGEQLREEEVATEKPIQSDVTIEDSRPRVTFTVFGEEFTGTMDGDVIVGDDGTRYQPTMVQDVKEVSLESKIKAQEKVVNKLWNEVKGKLKEDKQGIIIDFEQRAKDDIKFYNTVKNLVVEYAKLKGMQFSDAIKKLEQILKTTISDKDKKSLRGFWDEGKKTLTPKQQIKKATEGKPDTEKDTLVNKYQELKRGLRERVKAAKEGFKEGKKQATEKAKEKASKLQTIKDTVTQFVKDDLADIPTNEFTKREVNKIVTELNKAKTEHSVNKAIDQIFDTLAEAGIRKRFKDAKSKAVTAKRNVKSGKLGRVEPNSKIDQMLKINPRLIPEFVFNEYEAILDEIGKRRSVLSLSDRAVLNQRVNDVMDAVADQSSRAEELAVLYDSFDNKQYTESGKESYEQTVNEMLKDGEINQQDADFMKRMKSEIFNPPIDEVTEQDIEAAQKDTLAQKKNLPEKGTNQQENGIVRFLRSIKKEDLDLLSYRDIVNLGKVMDNVSNNYYPHLAEVLREKVEGNRSYTKVKDVVYSFKDSLWDIVSRTKAGIKNIWSPGSTSVSVEKIRRNPTSYIDQVLGNFKNTTLYDNTFRKLGQSFSSFENEINTIVEKLIRAEASMSNSNDKQFESRAKLMMIALQKEFESNPGQKTHPASTWLQATINDANSIYQKEAKAKLQEIFDSISVDGELDLKKALKSLDASEKKALKTIEGINNGLKPKADYTATVIRGNRVPIYDNYIHVPLAVKGGRQNEIDVKDLKKGKYGISTKAGTLTERTGKAHAISFDIFENVSSGARKTLLDYHMTPSVREVNQTMKMLEKNAETDKQLEAAQALNEIYQRIGTNVLGETYGNSHILDSIMKELIRKGYQATLSGVGRSLSELTSNAVFAFGYRGKETMTGIRSMGSMSLTEMSSVVANLQSNQTTRLFDYTGMDSRHVDFSKLNIKEVSKVTGYDEGALRRMFKAIKDNPAYEFVDNVQAFMVSKPDQLIARPMWFGSFETQFEAITGKKPDMKKIAENDADYMDEHYEALKDATSHADGVMVEAVASSNPFDGIERNQVAPSDSWLTTFYKTYNGYMTRFPTYEYNSAVRGVYSLFNNGMLTRKDAFKLLAALNARLVVYSVMTGTLVNFAYRGIASLMGYEMEDDEEMDDLATKEYWIKEALTSLAMLSVHRNLGNVSKIPINWAIESANKKYGEGITYTGEYDGFHDNIVYPFIPVDNPSQKPVALTAFENAAGPLSPMVRTTVRGLTAVNRAVDSKKEATREKYKKELMTRTPLEVFGNLGYIPFYKDVRQIQLKIMYETMEKAEEVSKDAYQPTFQRGTKK